jgi:serine protease inhibitor
MHKKCFIVLLYLVAHTVCAQRPLTDSNNEFALDFYKARSSGHQNIVVAPFSISCAIGMMYPGMNGETAEEVHNAFFFNKKVARHVDDFSDLLTQLENPSGPLKISNSLWLRPGINFLPSFLNVIEESWCSRRECRLFRYSEIL